VIHKSQVVEPLPILLLFSNQPKGTSEILFNWFVKVSINLMIRNAYLTVSSGAFFASYFFLPESMGNHTGWLDL